MVKVNGHQGFVVVVQDAFEFTISRLAHHLVHLIHRGLACRFEGQVHQRHVDRRHSYRKTIKPAIEFWQDQPHGGCRTGGGRNHGLGRGTGAPKVLVIDISQNLVIGISMDRGHHPRHHADLLVQGFDQWSEAVGCTGGVGDDRIARLQHTVINTVDNSRIHILTAGCGDDDLFRTPREMGAGFFFARKKPSALHHYINTQLGPGQLCRIPLGQNSDPFFTH